MSTARLLAVLFTLAIVSTWAPAAGAVSGYRFVLPEVEADPGDELTLTVKGEYERSAQGFVMAARYPADDLAITRVHPERTILEALHVDFFEVTVVPEEGYFVVSALLDTRPPFTGDLIPNLGFALDLFHVEVRVLPGARGDLTIALVDGVATPPVRNAYSVDNASVPVSELGAGTVHVGGETAAALLRGDANLSGVIDIADPIMILGSVFLGARPLPCRATADANADESIDIADPIYLLGFLFGPGAPPPSLGPDATTGEPGCSAPR